MSDNWLPDPSVLNEPPGWMPEDALPLGKGRFAWRSGRTYVYADFSGIKRFERGGEEVGCVCDLENGITCQRHEHRA
jgi:hypothetical protein